MQAIIFRRYVCVKLLRGKKVNVHRNTWARGRQFMPATYVLVSKEKATIIVLICALFRIYSATFNYRTPSWKLLIEIAIFFVRFQLRRSGISEEVSSSTYQLLALTVKKRKQVVVITSQCCLIPTAGGEPINVGSFAAKGLSKIKSCIFARSYDRKIFTLPFFFKKKGIGGWGGGEVKLLKRQSSSFCGRSHFDHS